MCVICTLCHVQLRCSESFYFNHSAPTEIYTLSLHDALPIYGQFPRRQRGLIQRQVDDAFANIIRTAVPDAVRERIVNLALDRSEEHTSELQSHSDLVCRLLLEKKKNNKTSNVQAANAT